MDIARSADEVGVGQASGRAAGTLGHRLKRPSMGEISSSSGNLGSALKPLTDEIRPTR